MEALPHPCRVELLRGKKEYEELRLFLTDGEKKWEVLYWRQRRSAPLILLAPPAGTTGVAVAFARYYSHQGLHCVLALRKKGFLELASPEEIETKLRERVKALLATSRWASSRHDVKRVGAVGISLGSVEVSILSALNPEIEATVLILPGGDIAKLLLRTSEDSIAKARRMWISEVGRDKFLQSLNTITSNPLHFAPQLRQRDIMMVVAMFDRVMPLKVVKEFRQECGRPRTIWLPTGHYTSILFAPLVKWQTARFLKSTLIVGR